MKRIVILIWCAVLSFLCGCSNNIDGWDNSGDVGTFTHGSERKHSLYDKISVNERGLFFISDSGLLSYYDYNSDASYILCSVPNCSHLSTNCIANSGSTSTGFAMYGDYCYYLRQVTDSAQWELIQVDIAEQTIDILATLGNDGNSMNQWFIVGIGDVYYNSNKAWITLNLYYNAAEKTGWNDNGIQLVAVDLADGSITELTKPMMQTRDAMSLRFSCFGDQYVEFTQLYYPKQILSFSEYEQQYGEGASNSYSSYVDDFFRKESKYEKHFIVDIGTMEISVFSDGICGAVPSVAWFDQSSIVSWTADPERMTERYHLCSVAFKPSEEILVIENGGAMAWFMGETACHLFDDDSLVYLKYRDDGNVQVWKFILASVESHLLFEYPANEYDFQIVGQTSDRLIGVIDGATQYAWIWKDDYNRGNYTALHTFTLGS